MKLSHLLSSPNSPNTPTVRKHIPWICSPLDKKAERPGLPEESKLSSQSDVHQSADSHLQHRDTDFPIFKHHHESSTIELFYDLFFVANLATFTADHEIESKKALGSYMGFFCLLWFTWLQTSLFDVRFSSDSVFSRVCKCISFGVMTGFSVVGSLFDTATIADNTQSFRAMSLVLMVSRLALIAQYGVVWWYVRGFKKTTLPLASTMAILGLTSIGFLGLFFAFVEGENTPAYAGWYVLVVFEALAVIAVSSVWRVVSFKRTYLVERVGLLTLIIMGEGIVGMSSSVARMMQNKYYDTTPSDIGVIVAAVLLIYFVWVLYFDQIEHDRFGTIRQQFWTLLHFPLHVALLLTVEGSAKFIVWNVVIENFVHVQDQLNIFIESVTPGKPSAFNTSAEYIASLNQTLLYIDDRFKESALPDFSSNFTAIQSLDFNSSDGKNATLYIMDDMMLKLWVFILKNFGVVSGEDHAQHAHSDNPDVDEFDAVVEIFATVLTYFFVGAGAFLIILGVMYWFGKKNKKRGEVVSIGVRMTAGVGLILVILVRLNDSYFFNLLGSPWMIPIVVIVYAIVIVLDNLLTWHTNKKKRVHDTKPRGVESENAAA